MDDRAFCESRYRLHAVGLVLFASAVMAWAMVAPAAGGTRRVRRTVVRAPVAEPPVMVAPPNPPATAASPVLVASPVARTQIGPPVAGVDVVGGATPRGGLRFVGDLQPGSFQLAARRIQPSVVSIATIAALGLRRQGSGVIVDPSGYVVTSQHVVSGASAVTVTVAEGETARPATVVATDPVNDLALLLFASERPLAAATLADSSRVQIGEWVLAVGHPFGLGLTVTSGIVGAKRSVLSIRGGTEHRGLIQTDAPINEGSSGGPLVNLRGEVVGINTAIYAPTGVFSGAGFAVPSNRVGAFVSRSVPTQVTPVALVGPAPASVPAQAAPDSATQVWLGVGLVELTPSQAADLSFPGGRGLYVSSVALDSPADEAEMLRGDIVTTVAGQPVADVTSLSRILAPLTPGTTLAIEIWRGGKTEQLSIRTRPGSAVGAR